MKTESNTTQGTSYLYRPEGRIGYDVGGVGPLIVLVPGMGDLRAAYRFLAPELRAAGYRVACTDLRGHGDSDANFASYGDVETASDIVALIEELGGPAIVVGNSMGAGAAVFAAAERPRTDQRTDPRRSIRTQRRNDRDAKTAPAYRNGPTLGGTVMERLFAKALQRNASR